uniref:PAZ domain-containing protein n=1 Tax=Panagrolaimus sp. JU765 TaxID=591449 RepID=A0AC34RE79_9BILA
MFHFVDCLSSQFPITIKKGAAAYRYDVEIIWYSKRKGPTNLTGPVDKVYEERNNLIISSLRQLKDVEFVYDKRHQLWTSKPLEEDIDIELTADHLPEEISSMFRHGSLEITETPFERGLVYRLGCDKDLQLIQSGQNVQPLITMDTQKKLFYPSGKNFLQALNEFGSNGTDYTEFINVYSGVLLRLTHHPGKIVQFDCFSKAKLMNAKNSTNEPLVNFLKAKYNITLVQVNVPTAYMKNARGDFPLELLEIIPGQDVPTSKLPADLGDKQKAMNIVKPSVRYDDLQQMFKLLKFDNPTMRAFGCAVGQNMLQAKFSFLPAPKITMPNDPEIIPDPKSRSFRLGREAKFVLPGEIFDLGSKHTDLINSSFRRKDGNMSVKTGTAST